MTSVRELTMFFFPDRVLIVFSYVCFIGAALSSKTKAVFHSTGGLKLSPRISYTTYDHNLPLFAILIIVFNRISLSSDVRPSVPRFKGIWDVAVVISHNLMPLQTNINCYRPSRRWFSVASFVSLTNGCTRRYSIVSLMAKRMQLHVVVRQILALFLVAVRSGISRCPGRNW